MQAEIPTIIGDDNQLQQVFINIIVNAVHAMSQGGTLIISTRLEKPTVFSSNPNGFICITFSDTGCGISDKNIQKIFDPFFTTKDVNKGTGLGLTVSHRIIEDHNGSIEVESKVNKGTRFVVRLPIHFREDAHAK